MTATLTTGSNPPSANTARRIAHVTYGFEVGGAEKLLVEFARHADRRRFELTFVALGPDGPIRDLIQEHDWPTATMQQPHGLSFRLVADLARYFRREKIDVIHTHTDRPHLYATLAGRLAGVRQIVHTRHGQCVDLSPRQQRLVRFLVRWVRHFVCVSDDAAAVSRRQGIPAERLVTIRNGIDVQQFAYRQAQTTGPVLTVARLNPEKDLGTLLEAIARAAPHDPSLRLVIAGDGPCRREWEQLARRSGIDHRVEWLGMVHDVAPLLTTASLFVISSQSEGIPLTLLEAQASGLPVIATRVGGIPEVIIDGQTGRLVPAQNAQDLAECLLALRRDPDLCHRLGQAARARIEQHFDVRCMVRKYEELYLTP